MSSRASAEESPPNIATAGENSSTIEFICASAVDEQVQALNLFEGILRRLKHPMGNVGAVECASVEPLELVNLPAQSRPVFSVPFRQIWGRFLYPLENSPKWLGQIGHGKSNVSGAALESKSFVRKRRRIGCP